MLAAIIPLSIAHANDWRADYTEAGDEYKTRISFAAGRRLNR
jgi:hypothetical protein